MWTFALTSTGVVGLWLVARHWYGWLFYLLNEALWLAYAVHTHDHPLTIMAVIWGVLGLRNLVLARHGVLQSAWSQQYGYDYIHKGRDAVPSPPAKWRIW